MHKTTVIAGAALLACAPCVAVAQVDGDPAAGGVTTQVENWEREAAPPEWVLPDPATVVVPDLRAGSEFDASRDPKYFYFRKSGVSFERAAYDVRECLSFSRAPNEYPSKTPGFATLYEVAPIPRLVSTKFVPTGNNQYGLVGAVLAPILMRSLQRRHQQSIMRVCMGYKGYGRYPTTREAYIALTEGNPLDAILMQAKVASGPKPDTESAMP